MALHQLFQNILAAHGITPVECDSCGEPALDPHVHEAPDYMPADFRKRVGKTFLCRPCYERAAEAELEG